MSLDALDAEIQSAIDDLDSARLKELDDHIVDRRSSFPGAGSTVEWDWARFVRMRIDVAAALNVLSIEDA